MITINDEDKLWRIIKKQYIKSNGTLKHTFFRDSSGLSCDLAKLTSIEKVLARKEFVSFASTAGIREFDAGTVRNPDIGSDVIYRPLPENDAHCVLEKTLDTQKCKLMVERSKNIKDPSY